jgi:hypothetical protein
MDSEHNPPSQSPAGDAGLEDDQAARLDETDAGDWTRSAASRIPRPAAVAPAPSGEREQIPGDPLDSGAASPPMAGAANDAAHAAPTPRRDGGANRDPITGEPGAHPAGVGVGAAGGAVTGMAVGGAVGGAVGAAIGAVVGGMAGGLAGKGIAEVINPTIEEEYWRANHARRPYAAGRAYEELAPAYRYGWESRAARPASHWSEVAPDLERGWRQARGASTLGWNEVHVAVEEAWVRVDERLAGRSGQEAAAGARSHATAEAESVGSRR